MGLATVVYNSLSKVQGIRLTRSQLVILNLAPNHFTRNPEFASDLVDQSLLGVLIFKSGADRIGRRQELRSECSGLRLAVRCCRAKDAGARLSAPDVIA